MLALSACMGPAQRSTSVATTTPAFSPPPTNMADSCGALPLAHLAGQHFSALADVPLHGALRVLHPLQPITMDFSPTRLNARVDAHGRIQKLTCG